MCNDGFIKQFSVISGSSIINIFLGLLSTPIITRLISPKDYGQFSIFTMYSDIFLMILCLGLDQAFLRYYYNKNDLEYKRSLLFHCIVFPIIAWGITTFVLIIGYLCNIFTFDFNIIIIVLLCIHTLDQIVYRFGKLILRLEQKIKLFSLLQIIQKIIYILLSLILFYTIKKYYLLLIVISTVISYLVCALISICFQKNIWKLRNINIKDPSIPMKEIIKYSIPFIFSMGITTFFQSIDKISLLHYRTADDVGIYSSSMKLVAIFGIVQTSFNTIWAPRAVEHFSLFPDDKEYHQRANQIMTVIMFFMGLTLILMKDFFVIFLGESYRKAANILPFLIFHPIMYTISETTVVGLVFKKKSKLQILVSIGACITNILGNMLLCPRFGGQGAAISTGISYIVFYFLRTLFSNHYYHVNYYLPRFIILTFITCLYALYNTFVDFSYKSVCFYIICILILFGLYRKIISSMIKYVKFFFYKKK